MQRILDRLHDTPAQVMGQAGVTLRQTPPAVALLGEEISYQGLARSAAYRWFTDPEVGRLDVYCQILSDTESGQALLICTATPGSKSQERLALLGVIGSDFPR